MILKSLKTDGLLARKFSLNIEEIYVYTSILFFSLHLIQSIIGMVTKLDSDFTRNSAKNAWN